MLLAQRSVLGACHRRVNCLSRLSVDLCLGLYEKRSVERLDRPRDRGLADGAMPKLDETTLFSVLKASESQ